MESRRVKMDGHHSYFLEHANGNKLINGKNYYQGHSYYSFFGDPERFERPTLFTSIDETTMNTEKKIIDIVQEHTDPNISLGEFWSNSPYHRYYDYKNSVLDQDGNITQEGNLTTAYMFNGILYNRNEAGNILWGATSALLRINDFVVNVGITAAHYLHEDNGEEDNEYENIFMGRNIYSRNVPLITHITYKIGSNGLVPVKGPARPYYHIFKLRPQNPGVDPTNENGAHYDEWNEIRK